MKTSSIFFLSLIFLLTACTPDSNNQPMESEEPSCLENCLIFEGTVYDKNREIFVSDVSIRLHARFGFAITDRLYETVSDDSGSFSIKIDGERFKKRENYWNLILSFSHEDYLFDSFEGRKFFDEIDSTNFDMIINSDYVLYPKAELTITSKSEIENVSGLNCKLSYNKTEKSAAFLVSDDFSKTFEVAANQFLKIEYDYRKDSIRHYKVDSVYIQARETEEFILNFD